MRTKRVLLVILAGAVWVPVAAAVENPFRTALEPSSQMAQIAFQRGYRVSSMSPSNDRSQYGQYGQTDAYWTSQNGEPEMVQPGPSAMVDSSEGSYNTMYGNGCGCGECGGACDCGDGGCNSCQCGYGGENAVCGLVSAFCSAASECGGGCASSCGCGYGESCGGGCGDCCGCGNAGGWCSVCPGWVYQADAVWLRPHDSEAFESDDQFHSGSRYMLGYMNGCGRSLRVRYFEYEADLLGLDGSDFLQLETFDLEYAGRFEVGCNWTGEFSAGLRWAQFEEQSDLAYADTIGPVVGVEMRTEIWCNTSLFTNLRQSYQFGHAYSDAEPQSFGSFGISEVQLGVEFHRCMYGGTGFLRGIFETQWWSGVYEFDSQDVGLIGLGIAAGYTR